MKVVPCRFESQARFRAYTAAVAVSQLRNHDRDRIPINLSGERKTESEPLTPTAEMRRN